MIARHLEMLSYNLPFFARPRSVCWSKKIVNLRERFPNNQKINFSLIHRTCPPITIFTLAIDRLNPGAVEDRGGDDGAQGAGRVPEDATVL